MESWWVVLPVYIPAFESNQAHSLDLSTLVPACLQVEGTLILQPPPVAGHAANLLTVVVWRRICERGDGRINTVTLDAVKEGRVFLCSCQLQNPHPTSTFQDDLPL